MVVTNLRIPNDEYREIKEAAANHRMSVNEYIRRSLVSVINQEMLGTPKKKSKKRTKKRHFLLELAELAKMPNKPMGPLSEEDQIIYGLKK